MGCLDDCLGKAECTGALVRTGFLSVLRLMTGVTFSWRMFIVNMCQEELVSCHSPVLLSSLS